MDIIRVEIRIVCVRNYIKLSAITLFVISLVGCGNFEPDLGQIKKVETHKKSPKDVLIENDHVDLTRECMELGISTEEINIHISGLEREYTFLWLSDMHIITENDEIAVEDLETVEGRRESFKNAAGMYSDEFWSRLSKILDDWGADALFFGGDMIDYAANANIACLKEGIDNLDTPYLYVRADHDYFPYYCAVKDEEAIARLHAKIDGYEEISLIEFEDLCLVGINDSTRQISATALQKMKDICAKGKPVILITHVPLNSLYDTSLEEGSKTVWGDKALVWGENCAYTPDEITQEFMDLVCAEDSPVKEVLAGHLHFSWDGHLTENIGEHVFMPGYHGNIGIVKVGAH
ncbi:MAG: metallophosphoesterase [Acetatifactor sp.]|nr:metallophosphoesterase [Acetatifactor sp.]